VSRGGLALMGSVHALPVATEPWSPRSRSPSTTGRSLTWMKRHMRTGMPHRKSIPTAWPLFRLFEVDAWLRSRGESW
jgi:hypothetical protein